MSLNKYAMAEQITVAVLSTPVGGGKTLSEILTTDQRQQIKDAWVRIGGAIIDYVVENTIVTVTVENHTHSGVSTGGGTSGPPSTSKTEHGTVS